MPLPFPVGTSEDAFNQNRPFTISPQARQRHLAVFGKTGVGKSSLIFNSIAVDLHEGLGITVLDPHGSLISDVLDAIPRHRTNDVVFFNPKDRAYPIGINILEPPRDPDHQPLAVSYLISIFKKIWHDSWGPRMEDILRNSAFALIEQPLPLSLVAIPKLLTDSNYRAGILEKVKNPVVKNFFWTYQEHWDKRFREEAISPVLNKVNAFTANPLLRSILGQTRSSFDFRWLMDEKKILLCDLSKGALGEDVSSLLGSLILTKIMLAALSREDIPENERQPHHLYVDEVHTFTYGADLPSILSEARKYRLSLTIAAQALEQLPESSAVAVLSNCATIMSFRVSGRDAETLKHEFAMIGPGSLLQDLEDFKVYVRTILNHRPKGPHLVRAYPPFAKSGNEANRQKVINASRQRYGRRRDRIENKLSRFFKR